MHIPLLVCGVTIGWLVATLHGDEVYDTYQLVAEDGTQSDYFGYSVSVDGDTAVIGAYSDGDNGSASGSTYIYRFDGSDWILEDKLLPNIGEQEDYFGRAVDISGDTVVIGATGDDDMSPHAGAAYIFHRTSDDEWTQQAKILASDGAVDDYFGNAVSIDGDTAVVGSFWQNAPGANSGAAYIYRRTGTVWTQEAKLNAEALGGNAWFGYSVSLSGDTVVIGAPQYSKALIFQRTDNEWTEQAQLSGSENDRFGHSVSIDGDTVIVGAHEENSQRGSAYIFRREGSKWIQQQKLLASDGTSWDQFGFSVAVSGDVVLVGAQDDTLGNNTGSVYVFNTNSNGQWVEEITLYSPSPPNDSDHFGFSVSTDSYSALIGVPNSDWIATDAGSAYVFQLEDFPLKEGACCTNGGCVIARPKDCIAFLGEWTGVGTCDIGSCPVICPGDMNYNGVVDVDDLLLVIAHWGACQ